VLANFKKLANSCVPSSNSRQITTHAKFATWQTQCSGTHEEFSAACVLVLLCVNCRRRNRKRRNIIKVWKKLYISRNLTRVAYNTLVQELLLLAFGVVLPCRRNVQQIWTILNFVDELRCCTFVFTSVRHFVKCPANHVNREGVLIGWQSLNTFANRSHVKYEFANTKKLVKKLARIEASSICVCQLFLRRSHTPNWVCQHEFANFSLPCEGRLIILAMI